MCNTTWLEGNRETLASYDTQKVGETHRIQKAILASLDYLHARSIDGNDIRRAAEARWRDFEDCIVYQAARRTKADYILTRIRKDFENTEVPAITPQEFLARVHDEFELREGDDGDGDMGITQRH